MFRLTAHILTPCRWQTRKAGRVEAVNIFVVVVNIFAAAILCISETVRPMFAGYSPWRDWVSPAGGDTGCCRHGTGPSFGGGECWAAAVLGRRSQWPLGTLEQWTWSLAPALSLCKPVPRIITGDWGVLLNFKPAIVAVLEQEMKEDFSGRGKDAHIIIMICLRNSFLLDVISQVSSMMMSWM